MLVKMNKNCITKFCLWDKNCCFDFSSQHLFFMRHCKKKKNKMKNTKVDLTSYCSSIALLFSISIWNEYCDDGNKLKATENDHHRTVFTVFWAFIERSSNFVCLKWHEDKKKTQRSVRYEMVQRGKGRKQRNDH